MRTIEQILNSHVHVCIILKVQITEFQKNGISVYKISKATGIQHNRIKKFLDGGDMLNSNVEKLLKYTNSELIPYYKDDSIFFYKFKKQ